MVSATRRWAEERNLYCLGAPQPGQRGMPETPHRAATPISLTTPQVTIGSSSPLQAKPSRTPARKPAIREQTAAYGSIIKIRIRGSEEKHPCVTEFYVVSELGSFL